MNKEQLRGSVWTRLVLADYRTRYFGRLSKRLDGRDRWVGFIAAALASLALTVLIRGGGIGPISEEMVSLAAAGLNLAVVFLSLYLAFSRVGRLAVLSTWQYAKWYRLQEDYESLWLRLDSLNEEAASAELDALCKQEVFGPDLTPLELGENKRLANRCLDEAERFRLGPTREATAGAT